MKLVRLLIIILILASSGCASHKIIMPTMDLPQEPPKPKIQSNIIVQNNIPMVGYSVSDGLKLYEFLLRKDSYEEKLRYRIELMNQLRTK
jgi:hypothetical protein